MTDNGLVVCRRCGFANTPGDEFCGSCGAFLEWEGQATGAGAGQPPGPSPAPPAPGSDAVWPPLPADESPTAVWPPEPAPPPSEPGTLWGAGAASAATSPAAADAGLLRCPACGIANPSTRTFCQSCGTRLEEAPLVGDVSADQIAAAVSAPARSAASWEGRAAPTPPTRPRAEERRSGGIPGWLLAIGALGLLAGVAFVVGSTLLGGKPPDSGSTSAPASGPVTSGAPSGGAPSGGPVESEGTPAPAIELQAKSAKASSVLANRDKFAAGMVVDGKPETCWQEGAKAEKGQWIEVAFGPARLDAILVYNGYQISDDAYFANHRLKKVVITVNGRNKTTVTLADTLDPQRIELGGIEGAKRVRIEIVSVYKSKKTSYQQSPYDDAALGEIVLEGAPE